MKILYISCVVFCFVLCQKCSAEKIEAISDVVNSDGYSYLRVIYGNQDVQPGVEFTPSNVKTPPTVIWPTSDKYYLLCLIDPDAPSRQQPVAKNWLHWLVGNVPGNDISKGKHLAEYVGAGPPKGTGIHRYIFFLFEQPSKLNFTETPISNKSGRGRANFSLNDFAEKYNIQSPIAINYFIAQWDSYVPYLHKQLNGK